MSAFYLDSRIVSELCIPKGYKKNTILSTNFTHLQFCNCHKRRTAETVSEIRSVGRPLDSASGALYQERGTGIERSMSSCVKEA